MAAILLVGILLFVCTIAVFSGNDPKRPKTKNDHVYHRDTTHSDIDTAEKPDSEVGVWDPKHGHPDIPLPASRTIKGKAYVIDGDTFKIGATKIRLAGVDAPELDMPFGQKSKWGLINRCKGQVVSGELTGEQSHDRLVGTCYLSDGRDLGAELIKQGLALDYPKYSNGKYKKFEPKGARRKLKWVYIKERQEARG